MTLRGPHLITFGGATMLSKGDVTVEFTKKTFGVGSAALGTVDMRGAGTSISISFEHDGFVDSNLFSLISAFASKQPGAALHSNSALVLTPLVASGTIYTFVNVALADLPNLKLSSKQMNVVGNMRFTALCKSDKLPSEAGAFWTETSGGGSASLPVRNAAGFVNDLPVLAWGGSSPWDEFYAKDGVEIAFNMTTSEESNDRQGPFTTIFQDLRIEATLIPDGGTLTEANILTAMGVQNSGIGAMGASLTTGDPLTVTMGSKLFISLPNAALTRDRLLHSTSRLSQDAVTFVHSRGANSSGAMAAAFVFAATDPS